MNFLFGFPTPVIEIILVLVLFVLGCALYFGYRFETVESVHQDDRSATDTVRTEETSK